MTPAAPTQSEGPRRRAGVRRSNPLSLSTAQAAQHDVLREKNRSREELLRMELAARAREQEVELAAQAQEKQSDLGLLGKLLGGRDNAPTSVALIGMAFGIVSFFVCLHYAASSDAAETWHREADTSLAFAASALAFIFGRSSRR